MTAKRDEPRTRFARGMGRRHGRQSSEVRRRRSWPMVAMAAAALVVAACSSAGGSSSGGSPTGSSTTGSAGFTQSGPKAPGSDIGITPTQIRVAMIADVNTSFQPGLFQTSVNAVKAWADIVNAHGGLAGRKVVVDFCDSQDNPNATYNCVLRACAHDFAMVGTDAISMVNYAPIDGCKNAQGEPVGIANLAGFAFAPGNCDPDTFLTTPPIGEPSYCATQHDNPQTYTGNVADYRYYASHFKGLHGILLYLGDVPGQAGGILPEWKTALAMGIKEDGQGVYTVQGAAPQSAYIPYTQVIKQHGSTLAYVSGTVANMVLMRREAELQGVNTVKVWAGTSAIYDESLIKEGGAAVNGTYALLYNLPFLSEYQDNSALSALVKQVGGIANFNDNALGAYIEALLFQDAVNKAVANGGTLNRKTLFAALRDEHSFDADGIIGPLNVANHQWPSCVVIVQVQNGQWKRVYPSAPGSFTCGSQNLATVKMNIAQ